MARKERGLPVPDPEEWDGESFCLLVACVPDTITWRAMVEGQIYRLTRGWTYAKETGDFTQAQAIGWEIYDSIMTCKLDDLVGAINSLTRAVNGIGPIASGESDDMTTVINNYGCGCGCGDGSTTTQTGTTTPTNIMNPEGINGPVNQNPPVGLATWGEYEQYKCSMAHQIYNQTQLAIASFDQAITPNPFTSLLNQIANFITGLSFYWMTSETLTDLSGSLYNWATNSEAPPSFWTTVATGLDAYKNTLICYLYESPNTSQAILAFSDGLQVIIGSYLAQFNLPLGGAVALLADDVIENLISSFLMNDLFQYNPDIALTPEDCPCGSGIPTNTGQCYSVNTVAGLGVAQLLSDNGVLQVWRVTPSFEDGIYSADIRVYNDSNAQVAYQITDVTANNAPSGGFDTIQYNYQDGSQTGVFAAGCVDSIVYQDTAPGWSLDVTIDVSAMGNCAGCLSFDCAPYIETGTGVITLDGSTFNVSSASGVGQQIIIETPFLASECDQIEFVIEILAVNGGTPDTGKTFRWVDDPDKTEYANDWPPIGVPLSVYAIHLNSSTAFNADFRITAINVVSS